MNKKMQKITSILLSAGLMATASTSAVFAASYSNNENIVNHFEGEFLSKDIIDNDLQKMCDDLEESFNVKEKSEVRADFSDVKKSEVRVSRSAGSKAVKYAAKWLRVNYKKIIRKTPKWMRKYIQIDIFMEVIDAYVGVSDSVEEFIHDVLRDVLPKDVVNDWWVDKLTTTIMLIMPI